MDGEDMVPSYKQISRNEAKKMMEQDDGHVSVDVRRPDEFAAGHIPEAICIPNENIGTEKPEELPDLEQVILVYCRSGNRSKQAAQNRCDRYCERVHSKCSCSEESIDRFLDQLDVRYFEEMCIQDGWERLSSLV